MQKFTRRTMIGALALLGAGRLSRAAPPAAGRFTVGGAQFLLEGKPFQIRAGEMHYPRVPCEQWRNRFRQMRALGLNTLSTYAFWSQHEPRPGQWDFAGQNDLRTYLTLAAEEGLHTILRPGPYVCAEVDFGGLPGWLLQTPGLRVRSVDPRFLAATGHYLRRLADEIGDLQGSRGGPLLMLQFENEYGSFGRDLDYLDALQELYREAGFDAPLYTADGGEAPLFDGGARPSLPAVVNFGGDVAEASAAFEALAAFRPDGPRMAGEYWCGWFDHWGEAHHQSAAAQDAATVEWMMSRGHSFNLYMVHGGTSFGWLPGANSSKDEPYQPDTTSYDYDAPVDEAGRVTPKFHAIRDAIARHLPRGEPLPPLPADVPTQTINAFPLVPVADLAWILAHCSEVVHSAIAYPMEHYGQSYGYIVYRTVLKRQFRGELHLGEVRDEVQVFLDGQEVGALSRRQGPASLHLEWRAGQVLDLLCENTGRVGFGARFPEESKGLVRSVRAGEEVLTDWTVYPLPLTATEALRSAPVLAAVRGPSFWRGAFTASAHGGTFLKTVGWGRGHLWVNGRHLGRFWDLPPQGSLYLPGDWLRPDGNEVLLFSCAPRAGKPVLAGLADPLYLPPQ